MIYYLVTRQHSYTMGEYLASWGKALASRVRATAYGALPANRELPGGTYVFSDLERLTPLQLQIAASLWEQLERAGGVRLVNDPRKVLRRLSLLHTLHERGTNRFNAHPATDPGRPFRYPVFVREEREHSGSLSSLIYDEDELRRTLLLLMMDGLDPSDLLIVEFCDTKDGEGIYRKYSAFRIGDRILPRHVLFSRGWVQKDLDLLDPPHRSEIRAYVGDNPHEREIREVFDLAGIGYGRIDYGMLDGVMQVWEINTNPVVARLPDRYDPATIKFHEAFTNRFGEALVLLDSEGDPTWRIPVAWDAGPILDARSTEASGPE